MSLRDVAGIQVVHCDFLEPGQAFIFNREALNPKFEIVHPGMSKYDGDGMRRFQEHLYSSMRSTISLPNAIMIMDSDHADRCPMIPKPWRPYKYRGPRRRSRRKVNGGRRA